MVRTKKWHTKRSRVCHWCYYHILTFPVIYYWTEARRHGICLFYIVKNLIIWGKKPFHFKFCHFDRHEKSTWRNLLSIQNEGNWLVAMLSKELWLVQGITQLSIMNQALWWSMHLSSSNQSKYVHNLAYYINFSKFLSWRSHPIVKLRLKSNSTTKASGFSYRSLIWPVSMVWNMHSKCSAFHVWIAQR